MGFVTSTVFSQCVILSPLITHFIFNQKHFPYITIYFFQNNVVFSSYMSMYEMVIL